MRTSLPEETVAFLRDLDQNNTKEWFQANKKRYETDMKRPSREFVDTVNTVLEDISPDHCTPAAKAISRINRDIRFAADKTPYNTRVWAAFHNTTRDKGAGAGFYVAVSPTGAGIGAGAWRPPKPHIDRLRAHIAANYADLDAIVASLADEFGPLQGEKYKRVPKPWAADHPGGELLKHKGLFVAKELPIGVGTHPDFLDQIRASFMRLAPLVAFLDAGLA